MARLIYSTRAPVPEEALRLTEDVYAIGQAIRLLKTVDRYNVDKDPNSDVLFFAIQRLKQCQRYASRKLATEYLDPRKKRVNDG